MALEKSMTTAALPRIRQSAPIASPADYAASREIMLAASKNYSFASRFLPQEKRHHVEALYALLRVGDDRVDVSHNGFPSPRAAIDDWERTYWDAFERGDSPNPVMRAYLNTAVECGIPPGTMSAYFRAMREDLTVTRFPAFDDLLHYMDGSAIPVGRAMTYILDVKPPYRLEKALARADSLSIAMQLSNFWRDIGYDWGIGRVYLPQEDMDRFGVREADIAAQRVTPRFIDLLEFEIKRTERYYEHAREGVLMLASGRWGVMSGLNIYRGLLDGVRQNHYDVFTRKAGAGVLRLLSLSLSAWWGVTRV
jgi:phytoene synthase